MPYYLSRSSIKFQCQWDKKIADFGPNWALPDCNSSLNSIMAMKWWTKFVWSNIEEAPCCFSKVIRQISRSQGTKNGQFLPELSVSGLLLQFELTDGCEMMHKAWHSIENVPYCFPRSFAKFQGHEGWKIDDLNSIWVILLVQSQLSNPSDSPCS